MNATPSEAATPALLGGAPARVVVDLDAIAHNAERLADFAPGAEVMAIVKADGYGHGLIPTSRAAASAGVRWFGVAQLAEAIRLRQSGIEGRVLSWLHAPGLDYRPALDLDIDLAAPSASELEEIAAAAAAAGKRARVHLKVDTGLARNGAYGPMWPQLLETAERAQAAGHVEVVGLMTHFVAADELGNPENERQIERFTQAEADAAAAGFELQTRHMANSAATLSLPNSHWDLVRPGIALYGLTPDSAIGTSGSLSLRPAMSVTANVTVTKQVPAGQGVSYNHTYITKQATTLADIPLGYADGVPRAGSNGAPVMVAGKLRAVSGRVCMDQFVVDMGDVDVQAGDEAVLFGTAADGTPGPTATEWAQFCDTINYEIVSRMGSRLPRVYTGNLAKEFGLV